MKLSRSVVGPGEAAAVAAVLEHGYLGMGAETRRFEEELSGYLGGDGTVVCVSTGTAALQLALQALGIKAGDDVLVPTLTYVASFQAISATGATPVACDVREADGLLDLADARGRVTARTRAVMPVHYASYPGDLGAVYEFAREQGLRVIEDAAHAFGCEHEGKKVGSFGDIACFSFDGIKNITSGEGGAVVSSDATLIAKVRDLRLLGVERDTEKRYRGERSWEFEVTEQGWRYHMSDIMAAIGRVQLARFEAEFKPRRMALARRYRERFSSLPGVRLFDTDVNAIVPHILPVRILDGMRERVRSSLLEHGIEAGLHYKPNHLLVRFGNGRPPLPVAEKLYRELLTVPLHPVLDDSDVDRVVDVMHGAIEPGASSR